MQLTDLIKIYWLIILSLASLSLKGQVIQQAGNITDNSNQNRVYVAFPDTPPCSNSIHFSPNPQLNKIHQEQLRGKNCLIFSAGNYTQRISFIDLNEVIVKGDNSNFEEVILAKTTSENVVRIGNDSSGRSIWFRGSRFDNVRFYDLWFYGGNSVLNASLKSRSFELNKVKISHGDFAGILAKTDKDSSILPYSIKANFVHISKIKGEGVYIGQVNGTRYHRLDSVIFNHIYVDSAGREGFQTSHIKYLHINKGTFMNLGWDMNAGGAQRNNIQISDTFGTIENSIFVHTLNDTTKVELNAAHIQAHGLTFKNCVFISDAPLYIGNLESRDWWPGSYSKEVYDSIGGQKILFENCDFLIFNASSSKGKLAKVFGDIMDIEFRNCRYSNNLNGLFQDGRIDKRTYRLIDGGGNIAVPANQIPFPILDKLGRMKTSEYYSRGIGWLTPQ